MLDKINEIADGIKEIADTQKELINSCVKDLLVYCEQLEEVAKELNKQNNGK